MIIEVPLWFLVLSIAAHMASIYGLGLYAEIIAKFKLENDMLKEERIRRLSGK